MEQHGPTLGAQKFPHGAAELAAQIHASLVHKLEDTRARALLGHRLDLVLADETRAVAVGDAIIAAVRSRDLVESMRALQAVPTWLRYEAWYALARELRACLDPDQHPDFFRDLTSDLPTHRAPHTASHT